MMGTCRKKGDGYQFHYSSRNKANAMTIDIAKKESTDANAARALGWLRTASGRTGYGIKLVGAGIVSTMFTLKAQMANAGGYAVHPKIAFAASAIAPRLGDTWHMIGSTAQQCAPSFLSTCDTLHSAMLDGKVVLHDPLLSTMAAAALFIPTALAYLAFKK